MRLALLRWLLLCIAAVLWLVLNMNGAAAQGGPVLQSGNVVPGHLAIWGANGVIYDGGPALGGPVGTNPFEMGITNTGTPWCITDVPTTSPYHQLCLGANTLAGYGVLSYNAYGGAPPLPFDCIINGVFIPNCFGGGGTVTSISVTATPCLTATPNPITTTGTITTIVPITVPCGGTGQTALTQYNVLLGTGTSPVSFAPPGTAGFVLTSNGSAANPTFQANAGSTLINCNATHDALQSTAPTTFTCITDVAQFDQNQTWTENQAMSPFILTDGATIATNGLLRNYYKVTLTGNNHVLSNPTNLQPGNYTWYVYQDGTGGRTGFSTGTAFRWIGGTPTFSTGASQEDVINCLVDDVLNMACFAGLNVGGPAAAITLTVGTTTIASGTSGRVLYDNAGILGELAPTGTGNVVLATSPTISGLTVTGSLTATGLITTADLAASAVTYAKIQNEAASSLLGNPTGSPAAPSEITLGAGLAFSGTTLVATGASGIVPTVVTVTGSGPFTLSSTNLVTTVSSMGTPAAATYNLPTSVANGFRACLKDGTTNFNSNNATVKTTDGSTIDGVAGATGQILTQTHGEACFISDATNWWIE